MDKYILAAAPLDESIAFRGVKPFHNTLFSHYLSPISFPARRDVPFQKLCHCLMEAFPFAIKFFRVVLGV